MLENFDLGSFLLGLAVIPLFLIVFALVIVFIQEVFHHENV